MVSDTDCMIKHFRENGSVLKKYNAVIFVNGCFWHGHENCKYFRLPATRSEWWKEKIDRNEQNDFQKQSLLLKNGL